MHIPPNLELRHSPIHGLGIFCLNEISEYTVLGIYTGIEMTKSEFKNKYGNDTSYTYYSAQNFPNVRVVVAKHDRNFITYINEGTPNVKISSGRKLIAIRKILIGEELLLQYGKNYPRAYPT